MIDFSKPRTSVLFTFLLLILTAIFLDSVYGIDNFGMNKTVGNAWEFTDLKALLSVLVLFISFFSYAIMWFFGLKLNKTFTLFNLAFLIFCLGMMSSGFQSVYSLFALLMLLINIGYAITAKKYAKKKNLQ